jgi:hypothetical protein
MKVFARVLLGLGAFLLIAGILAVSYAPGVAKRTPLDVHHETYYTGEAAKIDPATGAFDKKKVFALQDTKTDSEKSTDDIVYWVETSCLVYDTGGARECVNGNDPDLVTADIDIFATDRVTALAVEGKDLPPDAGPHEGLVNKWPFDVEKKTYPYWDGTIGDTVDMKYDGTEDIKGLETYRFVGGVEDVPIDVAEGIPGTYTNTYTINVDPTTGSIIKGGQDQQRYLEDGTPVLDVQVTWDDKTIADAVDEAKTNGMMLTLLLTVLPIIGFAGGILCLLGGLALIMRERSNGASRESNNNDREKVSA